MTTEETVWQVLPQPEDPMTLLYHVMSGLNQLTPAEVALLDDRITEETADLMIKAFGPGMGVLLWPLVAGDERLS